MSDHGSAKFAPRGALTALVTPFGPAGPPDLPALRDLVRWQVDSGIHGLVPCGTTGEGATLAPEEQYAVISTVVEAAAKRVPVMAGCGSNDTRRAADAARLAAKAGADALLVVTPYYNKPNRSGMISHFEAVSAAAEIPVVLYNVPSRTGQNLGSELTLRLAEIPGVVGIKEASGNLDQIASIVAGRPGGFSVLCGDDGLAVASVALGADGLVSVVSNEAPSLTAEMVAAALDGNFARARELHYRLLPLMRANFLETSPVPVKTAMALLGRCREDVRIPLGPLEPSTKRSLERALALVGLRGKETA